MKDSDRELAAVPSRATSTAHDEKPQEQNVIKPEPHILLIDDQVLAREQLKRLYTASGYTVETVSTSQDALNCANSKMIDLVVVGRRFSGNDGAELIAQLQQNHPRLSIVLTGYLAVDPRSSDGYHIGCDYMAEPFDPEGVHRATEAALNKASVFSESMSFRESLNEADGEFGFLLSKTPAMHQLFDSIVMVAPTNMTVLLVGEAGTGKELTAKAIHTKSSRGNRPFIPVNCSGFPDSLLEAELFGCKEGGSYGTGTKQPGKIKLADGGTLFLDEIDSMAPFVQSKFMRVLEDCNAVHLGGHQMLDSDVRVIAATNLPVQDLVAQGKMRPDLYYRINVVPIHVLPLRERADDIPLLVDEFLTWNPMAKQKGITSVSRETIARLVEYRWPGNLRELQNVLEKAIVLTKGSVIDHVDLPIAEPLANEMQLA